jgi:hypothetical protein
MSKETYTVTLLKPARYVLDNGTVKEVDKIVFHHNLADVRCFSCGVCGRLLTLFESPHMFTCALCGAEEESKCACENGHYICKACWSAKGFCPVFPIE